MTMPLASCPHCGNSADGTILINAQCVAVIEKDQFDYFDCHFDEATAHASCHKCGHSSSFHNFKLGVKPPDYPELAELEGFLVHVARQHAGLAGEQQALRCLGLIRHHATNQSLAPAPAGE